MRQGRKSDIGRWDPLDVTGLPTAGWKRAWRWIERFCPVPIGYGQGLPLRLRRFQQEFLQGIYEPDTRVACLSVPKGNGKTTFLGGINLYELFTGSHPRIYAAASSERQSKILLDVITSMIEASEPLRERATIYADKIVTPHNNGVLQTLPASSKSLQGYRPAFVTLDESAEVADETAEALSLSLGKIPNSKLVCISSAPLSPDSFWWRWREAGLAGDEGLFWLEFAAEEGDDVSDPATWRKANPAYADFLDPAAVANDFKRVRIESFMRWRLNMCVETAGAFLPFGVFEKLGGAAPIPDGAKVCLGFDGSIGSLNTGNADGTAIVACSVDQQPTLELVALWSPPEGLKKDSGWSVPRAEVEAALERCMDRWDVVELAADPHHWRSELQAWAVRWPGRVIEWPSHVPQRAVPASDKFYTLVVEGKLRHTGDKRLEAHCRNAVVRTTSAGPAVVKDYKMSRRKIDACIAAIIGVDRALFYANQPAKRRRVYAF